MLAKGGIVQASAIGDDKALCLLFYRYDQILLFFFFLVGGNQAAWSSKWGSGLTNNQARVNALFVL